MRLRQQSQVTRFATANVHLLRTFLRTPIHERALRIQSILQTRFVWSGPVNRSTQKLYLKKATNLEPNPVSTSPTAPNPTPVPDANGAPRACLRYCLVLILLPLLAIPALIALGQSDFFLHHGASVWVQANDAVFDMRDRDCDVLVFGDSTAMTGIDPEVVELNTGFRTCNIAVTNAVLAVTDNLTLDRYLAHNARPRVLLVQLSPDDFQPENRAWRRTIYAEGMLELLRHGRPGEARAVLLSHPGAPPRDLPHRHGAHGSRA